jgi:hypothetical protein
MVRSGSRMVPSICGTFRVVDAVVRPPACYACRIIDPE